MNFRALLTTPLSYLNSLAPNANRPPQSSKVATPRTKKSAAILKAAPEVKPYRSTSIAFESCACDAVKALGDQRFLQTDGRIPLLPLPSCDASRCNCKYLHHDDRRDDENDRRLMGSLKTHLYEDTGSTNRRRGTRGRRNTDV